MDRAEYWHDEYEKAAAAYKEKRAAFIAADNVRAAAMAEMNRAEREMSRLWGLKFNPSPTLPSRDSR